MHAVMKSEPIGAPRGTQSDELFFCPLVGIPLAPSCETSQMDSRLLYIPLTASLQDGGHCQVFALRTLRCRAIQPRQAAFMKVHGCAIVKTKSTRSPQCIMISQIAATTDR